MKSQFLELFHPREVGALIGGMARHTRMIGIAKISLVAVALLLVAILVIIPLLEPEEAGLRIAFSGLENSQNPAEKPKMLKPSFQGVDDKNQPYTISADTAVQEDSDHVSLHALKADIMLAGEKWLALAADQGVLDVTGKTLSLSGNVSLFYDDGYEFHTAQAHADLRTGSAMGNADVAGQGPLGALKSKGFILFRPDRKLTFIGPVTMTIHPGASS